jgi:Domain of unknown function (DUF4331)
MSNHLSADNLRSPGDDARLDFTDPFVFKSSDDSDKTVLIMDSNPFMLPTPMTGPEFHPDAVYRINIDTDGDALADPSTTSSVPRSPPPSGAARAVAVPDR